jgi:LCP family protein required for cell wall assembly
METEPGRGSGTVAKKGKPRPRWGRRLLVAAVALLLAVLTIGGGGLWWSTSHYGGQVTRIPGAFPDKPDSERPPRPAETAASMNILLAGVDSRSDLPTTGTEGRAPPWSPGAQRTDSLMMLHLSADRRVGYLVALPRDSWVPIPGRGSAKINAAYSWGGPPLLIDTVETLTQLRVDHFAVIDWDGFIALTDSVGGVDITIPADSYDPAQRRTWKAGRYTMDGVQALSYVRQREGLPRGDLDRIARQQNFLRALMAKVVDSLTLTEPARLNRLLDAITSAISVDDRLSNSGLRDLAFGLRQLSVSNVTFVSAPVARFDRIDGQDVVILDREKTTALWQAVGTEDLPEWVHRYGIEVVGSTVR